MICPDYHVHTTFCDGKNTPEETVKAALAAGMPAIGFSGHSHTAFDESYCMSLAGTKAYKEEIRRLQQLYGDKMIFTGHMNCPKDASEEEQNRIIKEFFDTIGADNRVYVDPGRDCPEGFREKVYEASRRNYDRLVAEGRLKNLGLVINDTKPSQDNGYGYGYGDTDE